MADIELKVSVENNPPGSSLNIADNGFRLKVRDPTSPGRSDNDDSSSGGSVTSEVGSNAASEPPSHLKEIEIVTCESKNEVAEINFQDELRLSPEGKANTDTSSDTLKRNVDDKSNFSSDRSLSSTSSPLRSNNTGAKSSNGLNPHEILTNRSQGNLRVVVGADDENQDKKDKIAGIQPTANYYASSSNSYQNTEATWTSKTTTTMLTSLHSHHPNVRKIDSQSNSGSGGPLHHQQSYHYSSLPNGNGYHQANHHQNAQHFNPKPHYGGGAGTHRKHSPSRRRYGPPNSRGNSPCNGIGAPQSNPPQPVVNLNIVSGMAQPIQPQQVQSISNGPGQHVVDLHVNPGETISFQIGDQMQLIQGPATVRMVSNNSTPPVPMPVQVPPGHIVQQLVDENGTLRQIILSPQLGIALPPMHLHQHPQGPPQLNNPGQTVNPNFNPSGANNGTGGGGSFYGYPPPYVNPQFHPHMPSGGSGLTPPPNQPVVQAPSSNLQVPGNQSGGGVSGHHHHVHHHHHHHHGGLNNNNVNGHSQKPNSPVGLQITQNHSNAMSNNNNVNSSINPGSAIVPSSRDERSQKQFVRLKKKLEMRNQNDVNIVPQLYHHVGAGVGSGGMIPHPMMAGTPTTAYYLSPNHSPKKASAKGGARRGGSSRGFRGTRTSPTSMHSSDCLDDNSTHSQDEEEFLFIQDALSKMEGPTITIIRARSIVLKWKPPDLGPDSTKPSLVEGTKILTSENNNIKEDIKEEILPPSIVDKDNAPKENVAGNLEAANEEFSLRSKLKEMGISESDFNFELFYSDRKSNSDVGHKDARSRLAYSGGELESQVNNLKPATEYHFFVRATFDSVVGAPSIVTSCQTEPCEPDTPLSPKLVSKTKTSLMLKWNAPHDNGSKITSFSLEYDEGTGRDGHFVEVFSGIQKQFKTPKLNVSTRYGFRLSATNDLGKSEFSEVVYFTTSGSVPPQPLPPTLRNSYVTRLALEWQKRINVDEEFTLQMEDETTRHGFLPVYNGRDSAYTCSGLRRNSEYKFRVCALNDEGSSPWSKVVAFSTLPDKPGHPGKPSPKGKIHSNSFRLEWDPPKDDGGSVITKYVVEIDKGKGFEVIYTGLDSECQCDSLCPGTTYRVRVICCGVGGTSAYSEPSCVTTSPVVPGVCAPPRLHGKPKALLLHLKWGPPDYNGGSPITEYEVDMTSPDNTTRSVFKGRETDCVVASLLPGRPYLFQVRASNRVGPGLWSEPFETVSGAGPPDSPNNLQVASRSPHSIFISWEEPMNNGAIISEYRVDWSQNQDEETDYEATFSLFQVLPTTSYEVKNLIPATRYLFKVQAVNSAGPGTFSEIVTVVTPASSPASISSSSIELVSCEANYVILTWKEPPCHGSPITSYNLEVVSSGEIVSVCNFAVEEPTKQLEYTVLGLNPETSYRVRIQATNSIGPSPFSSSLKITTRGLPPAPPALELVAASQNSLKLKWGDGRNPEFIQYTLEMENSRTKSFVPVYVGTSQIHKVSKLQECSSYRFRILASNGEGEGPYSDEYVFQTTKALPPSLKAPKVSWNANFCNVEWTAVKAIGEDPISYVLQLQNTKDTSYQAVYQGSETSYSIETLVPKVSYAVRVAAVRHCSDGEVLQGAWSPSVSLGQPENAGNKSLNQLNQGTTVSGTNGSSLRRFSSSYAGVSSLVTERKPLTDQQWAMIILLGFTVFAILVAMAIERFIS